MSFLVFFIKFPKLSRTDENPNTVCVCVVSHPQSYRERERDHSVPNIHELSTRTVTMSRDQQDGHGFGICVKGGKDSGMCVCV